MRHVVSIENVILVVTICLHAVGIDLISFPFLALPQYLCRDFTNKLHLAGFV